MTFKMPAAAALLGAVALFSQVPQARAPFVPVSAQTESGDDMFDVRHGDDRGKLIVSANQLSFEDVSNAKHSRTWNYSQIKELKRNGKEIKLEPYSGDSYEFKLDGKAMSDSIYRLIADRIVAARHR